MSELTTTMTVRVPMQLKEQLDQLAQRTARSKSWLVADAIRAYIELHEWQISEIEAGIREADAGEFASQAEVEAVFARWTRAH